MTVLKFEYPKALTNASWQKAKGLRAKGTKTGVGEALTALEKAVAKSPFGKLDPDQMGAEAVDQKTFEKKVESLRQSLAAAVRSLDREIKEAEKVVGKATVEFAKQNKQDTRKLLEGYSEELARFREQVKEHAIRVVGDTQFARTRLAIERRKNQK